MVRIVITPEFFGVNEKRSSIKKQLNSWGAKSIAFNKDGMILAVMTELQFEEFMKKLKAAVEGYISDIIKKYPCIGKITHDNSYTNFTVIGKKFTSKEMKSIAVEFDIAVASYQIFNGIPQDKTSVIVKFRKTRNGKDLNIIDTSL